MLVLIAGITGTLGQRLATTALSRGLSVRGLGRNPSSLPAYLSTRLESFVTSTSFYDIPALNLAVTGVSAIINAYAPNPLLDLDGHLLLLRAAERAGVKIFIASSWSRDWSNLKFGDFEHYNNHIAFEHQVATTSTIKPVYIITGVFADLLFTPYGPGMFTVSDSGEGEGKMRYWGEGDRDVYPWSTQDDASEWTIDILLHGKGVQNGEGGFFRVRSGVTCVREMAAVYEEVHGRKVEVERVGSTEDLERELKVLREVRGRKRAIEYMGQAAAIVASKGLWEHPVVTKLEQFREPTSLEEWLGQQKRKA